MGIDIARAATQCLDYSDLVAQLAGLQLAAVAWGHAPPDVVCVLLALL